MATLNINTVPDSVLADLEINQRVMMHSLTAGTDAEKFLVPDLSTFIDFIKAQELAGFNTGEVDFTLSGATMDGSTVENVSAINTWLSSSAVPDGSTVVFPAGKSMVIDSQITLPSDKTIRLKAAGDNFTILPRNASQGFPAISKTTGFTLYSVASIDTDVSYTVNSSNRQYMAIEVAAGQATTTNFPVGMRCKLVSTDIPNWGTTNSSGDEQKSGDWADVVDIDAANNKVIFTVIPNADTEFVTDPHICVPNVKPTYIDGLSIKYDASQVRAGLNDDKSVEIVGGYYAQVRLVEHENFPGRGVHFIGLANASYQDSNSFNIFDASHTPKVYPGVDGVSGPNRVPYYTYHVSFMGCGTGRVSNCWMVGGRHAVDIESPFVNPTGYTHTTTNVALIGGTSNLVCSSVNCDGQTSNALGDHGSSRSAQFLGCTVTNCHIGPYGIRGENTTIIGGISRNCFAGVQAIPGDATGNRQSGRVIGHTFVNCGPSTVRGAGVDCEFNNCRWEGGGQENSELILTQLDSTARFTGVNIMRADKNGGQVFNVQQTSTVDFREGKCLVYQNGWDGASAGSPPNVLSMQHSNNDNKVYVGNGGLEIVGADFNRIITDYGSGSGNTEIHGYIYHDAGPGSNQDDIVFVYGGLVEKPSIGRIDSRAGSLKSLATDSTTTRTVSFADIDKVLRFTNAGATTVTIPPNGTSAGQVDFPVGTMLTFVQGGAGTVTIVGDTGVTVNTRTTLNTAGQYATVHVTKVAANTWIASGDLATS